MFASAKEDVLWFDVGVDDSFPIFWKTCVRSNFMVISLVEEGKSFSQLLEGVPEERFWDKLIVHLIEASDVVECSSIAVFEIELTLMV